MMNDTQFMMWCSVVDAMRREGASYRAIAAATGHSKSRLQREMPAIQSFAEEWRLSQKGQHHADFPRSTGAETSHAGQGAK